MKTRKIETLEDLKVERARLNGVAQQIESELQEDFQYFSNRIQPFLSIFDGSSSSGKISSLLLRGASTIVPLLLSRHKSKPSTPTIAASPWIALSSMALGLLASRQTGGLIQKIGQIFGSYRQRKKKRRCRHLKDKRSVC